MHPLEISFIFCRMKFFWLQITLSVGYYAWDTIYLSFGSIVNQIEFCSVGLREWYDKNKHNGSLLELNTEEEKKAFVFKTVYRYMKFDICVQYINVYEWPQNDYQLYIFNIQIMLWFVYSVGGFIRCWCPHNDPAMAYRRWRLLTSSAVPWWWRASHVKVI